jgi:hypothetical protein
LYTTDFTHASAVLRVDSISSEFQRRGFFRIGILPVLVVDGVVLEFRQLDDIGKILGRVPQYLRQGQVGLP